MKRIRDLTGIEPGSLVSPQRACIGLLIAGLAPVLWLMASSGLATQ